MTSQFLKMPFYFRQVQVPLFRWKQNLLLEKYMLHAFSWIFHLLSRQMSYFLFLENTIGILYMNAIVVYIFLKNWHLCDKTNMSHLPLVENVLTVSYLPFLASVHCFIWQVCVISPLHEHIWLMHPKKGEHYSCHFVCSFAHTNRYLLLWRTLDISL